MEQQALRELEALENRIEGLGDEHFGQLLNFLRSNFGVNTNSSEIKMRMQDYTPEQQRQLFDFVDRLVAQPAAVKAPTCWARGIRQPAADASKEEDDEFPHQAIDPSYQVPASFTRMEVEALGNLGIVAG